MKKEKYFLDELRKLFIGYAIIPVVVFTIACGLVFMAVMVYGKYSMNKKSNQYVASEIDYILTEYIEELDYLSEDPSLFSNDYNSEWRTSLYESIYGVSNNLGCKIHFYILDTNRNCLLSSSDEIPSYLNIPSHTDWGIYHSMNSEPGETKVQLMNSWKSSERALAMGKAVVKDDSIIGYLIFTLDSDQLRFLLEKADTQTIIADRFGWILLSNNAIFMNESNQVKEELKNSGKYISYLNNMYLVSNQTTYHNTLNIYTISDIQNIVVSIAVSSALVITTLIGMTAWVLISSRKATEKKTSDFYKILDVMERAQQGEFNNIVIESDNEFRIIADTYNQTINSLRKQMENNQKMAELVAASQNKQLQSQFNPHFLFNTLENIRYMCKIEPSIAERMMYSLSNLLRYSLAGNQTEVSLKEDLAHLENYINILKYRYNRRFSCEIDIAPEVMECKIPKLVLQPMIENSVKYGFGNQDTLHVELKAYIHEDKLIMICRDDGVGMTPSLLSELTALLEQEENTSRHSGIYNIHRRIQLLYGRPYGVEIRSMEGHGTTLVVTLPPHRRDQNVTDINS